MWDIKSCITVSEDTTKETTRSKALKGHAEKITKLVILRICKYKVGIPGWYEVKETQDNTENRT